MWRSKQAKTKFAQFEPCKILVGSVSSMLLGDDCA